MKPTLSNADWRVAFDRLARATQQVAELANLLDRCEETDEACNEAKRIELDLCVLESLFRHSKRRSESERYAA